MNRKRFFDFLIVTMISVMVLSSGIPAAAQGGTPQPSSPAAEAILDAEMQHQGEGESCWVYDIQDDQPIGTWINPENWGDPVSGNRVWAVPSGTWGVIDGSLFFNKEGQPSTTPNIRVELHMKMLNAYNPRSFRITYLHEGGDDVITEISTVGMSTSWEVLDITVNGLSNSPMGIRFFSSGGNDMVVMDAIVISLCYPAEGPTVTPPSPTPTATATPTQPPTPTATATFTLTPMPTNTPTPTPCPTQPPVATATPRPTVDPEAPGLVGSASCRSSLWLPLAEQGSNACPAAAVQSAGLSATAQALSGMPACAEPVPAALMQAIREACGLGGYREEQVDNGQQVVARRFTCNDAVAAAQSPNVTDQTAVWVLALEAGVAIPALPVLGTVASITIVTVAGVTLVWAVWEASGAELPEGLQPIKVSNQTLAEEWILGHLGQNPTGVWPYTPTMVELSQDGGSLTKFYTNSFWDPDQELYLVEAASHQVLNGTEVALSQTQDGNQILSYILVEITSEGDVLPYSDAPIRLGEANWVWLQAADLLMAVPPEEEILAGLIPGLTPQQRRELAQGNGLPSGDTVGGIPREDLPNRGVVNPGWWRPGSHVGQHTRGDTASLLKTIGHWASQLVLDLLRQGIDPGGDPQCYKFHDGVGRLVKMLVITWEITWPITGAPTVYGFHTWWHEVESTAPSTIFIQYQPRDPDGKPGDWDHTRFPLTPINCSEISGPGDSRGLVPAP